FEEVLLAYRLPKSTEEEKAIRLQTIEETITQATAAPLDNARNCANVLDLCRKLEPNYNKNTASDLNSAIYLAQAGLFGCVENVKINLIHLKNQKVVNDITGVDSRKYQKAAILPWLKYHPQKGLPRALPELLPRGLSNYVLPLLKKLKRLKISNRKLAPKQRLGKKSLRLSRFSKKMKT
ncbi:MAG: cyclodeaminase/cyclohydrolase family protein, partial [Candidatus Omnitrophica bacterium]|nr:cyclodeaminase/cyclohydrolase family protein [Candidatus Omnitrophota bacterium]